jgi:hypothetical protein
VTGGSPKAGDRSPVHGAEVTREPDVEALLNAFLVDRQLPPVLLPKRTPPQDRQDVAVARLTIRHVPGRAQPLAQFRKKLDTTPGTAGRANRLIQHDGAGDQHSQVRTDRHHSTARCIRA